MENPKELKRENRLPRESQNLRENTATQFLTILPGEEAKPGPKFLDSPRDKKHASVSVLIEW